MDEYFCPNCGAILNYQTGFSPDCGAWTCTECGAHLHRDYSFDEFSIKENDEDESTQSINDDVENDTSEDNIQFEKIKNTIVKKLKKFATLISKDKKIKIGISSATSI